jgi:hypothetical protein
MESITILNIVFQAHTFPLLATVGLVVVLGLAGLVYTVFARDL